MGKDYKFSRSSESDVDNIILEGAPTYKKRQQQLERKRKKRNPAVLKKVISWVLVFTMSGFALDKIIDNWPSFMEEMQNFYDEYNKNEDPYEEYGLSEGNDSSKNYDSSKGSGSTKNYDSSEGNDSTKDYDSSFISDIGELYDDATTYVSDLYKNLDLDSSLECYYVYNYLDDRGLLSLHNSKKNKEYMDLYLDDMLGADILYQKGACRHEADFYVKTLNKYGIDAIVSTCFMGRCNQKYTITVPNHAIVVVNDNNMVTYQDTLSDVIFDKYDLSYDDMVFEQTFNAFCYMMPEYSNYKNVICTQNSSEKVSILEEWIAYDNDGVGIDYIDKEFGEAQEKIDNNASSITEFEHLYTDNIKRKLPVK